MKKLVLSSKCNDDSTGESQCDCEQSDGDPAQELVDESFGQNFHRMFDSFFSGKHPLYCPEGRAWNPPTDIFETPDALHVKIEVAGLREKDIEIKVNQDYLIIRGTRTDEHREDHARFHLMEIHYGSFERILKLPHVVDVDKIAATLQNGFLLVKVPRESSTEEYRIEID